MREIALGDSNVGTPHYVNVTLRVARIARRMAQDWFYGGCGAHKNRWERAGRNCMERDNINLIETFSLAGLIVGHYMHYTVETCAPL